MTGRKMVVGSAWTIGMRWAMRAAGLGSTVILARLLAPTDFGLVAMAMVVVGLVEVFGDTGQRLALIRHSCPVRRHYDTAWTLSVLQGVVLASVMWLVAPLGAAYFGEPRATLLIRVLALRALVGGFENIGVVAFRKDLDFAKDFRFNVAQKCLTVVLTLAAAVVLRNYWALVIGIVFGRVASTALSYHMHPYRPAFSLAALGELWAYSNWMLVLNLGDFLYMKTDEIVVGRVGSPVWMGYYATASDVATAPTLELVTPLSRALFPGYSRLRDRPADLRRAYLATLTIVAILCSATGAGVALVAEDLVAVMLGSQWTTATPLVVLLALAGAVAGIGGTAFTVLTVSGEARAAASFGWLRNALLIPATAAAGAWGGATAVAAARLSVVAVMAPILLTAAGRTIALGWHEMFAALWRPALSTAVMAAAVTWLNGQMTPGAARLVVAVSVGGGIFVATHLLAWALAGRPDGPEKLVARRAAATTRSIWLRNATRRRRPAAGAWRTAQEPVAGGGPGKGPFLKATARALAFRSGLLSLHHRLRNRRSLTVVLFHRVLPAPEARRLGASPEWTVTPRFFRQCLRFFAAHYHVVALADVLSALDGGPKLPPRALLITFDDGWADTESRAAPLLERAGLPAAVFVVASAVGSHRAHWETGPSGVRQDGGRPEMLSEEQLRRLPTRGIAVGSHGLTHTSLTEAADPAGELSLSRLAIAGLLRLPASDAPRVFAFPNGRHDGDLLRDAATAGYDVIFTSEAHLNRVSARTVGSCAFGRINVSQPDLSDACGSLREDRLATWLFTRPIRAGATIRRTSDEALLGRHSGS